MISRRLVRIKVLKILYSYLNSNGASIENAEKEMIFSIKKTYELYHFLMVLPIEVANYARQQIELGKQKNRPTEAEKNPNTKFIDNTFVQLLQEHKALQKFDEEHKFNWQAEVVRKIYLSLVDTEYYKQYMQSESRSFTEDKLLVIKIFEETLEDDEMLYAALEDQSLYWTDDTEFCLSQIIKTLKQFSLSGRNDLLPIYKDEDDERFARRLFSVAAMRHAEYMEIIDRHTKNWDVERVAFMDIIIMLAAITELVEFPNIPVKVSLNEYIEIAKYYSTPSSSNFINGVLDKIVGDLKTQQLVTKQGKGLME